MRRILEKIQRAWGEAQRKPVTQLWEGWDWERRRGDQANVSAEIWRIRRTLPGWKRIDNIPSKPNTKIKSVAFSGGHLFSRAAAGTRAWQQRVGGVEAGRKGRHALHGGKAGGHSRGYRALPLTPLHRMPTAARVNTMAPS